MVHMSVRLGEDDRLCLLVVIGVRDDGVKELLAVEDGYRESTDSWAVVLRDLTFRLGDGGGEPPRPRRAGGPVPRPSTWRAARRGRCPRRLDRSPDAGRAKRCGRSPSRRTVRLVTAF
jgi:hypothetical protein